MLQSISWISTDAFHTRVCSLPGLKKYRQHSTHSQYALSTLTLFSNQIFSTLTQYSRYVCTDPEIRNCLLCKIWWQWGSCLFSLKIVVLPSSIVNGCFKTCAFFGDYKSIQRGIMHHNDVQRTQAHILTFKV